MSITRPANYSIPFANAGTKNTIPNSATGTNAASFTEGFPPVTMLPIPSGGIPPKGADFNGILYDITTHTIWVNSGGQYLFDSALATAIGGYPVGMVLQNTAGTASYVSAVANNTTDFNSTPASIGVQWLPYAGNAWSNIQIATTGGNTTLTATQAAGKFITVTGALVSNVTLTMPAALGRWHVINATSGAFSVTVIAAGGAGVPVFQGGIDTLVCDATNVRYDIMSGVTRPNGDNTKALATTEFFQSSITALGLKALAFEGFGWGLMDDGAGNAKIKLADTSLSLTAAGLASNSNGNALAFQIGYIQ